MGVVATGAVGWIAHNYRQNLQLQLSDKRLSAYTRLWEVTGVAAPTRLDGKGIAGYLRPDERWRLWRAMTEWYYRDGNGLLLDDASKSVYLKVKHNLACRTEELEPEGLRNLVREELRQNRRGQGRPDAANDDVIRGLLAISQLSLLRTQLKSDLRIYGQTYTGHLLRQRSSSCRAAASGSSRGRGRRRRGGTGWGRQGHRLHRRGSRRCG